MGMCKCKHSKCTINTFICRCKVQTKYNILTGKKLSAVLFQKEPGGIFQYKHGQEVESISFCCSQLPL